jgi:hypothetical protein
MRDIDGVDASWNEAPEKMRQPIVVILSNEFGHGRLGKHDWSTMLLSFAKAMVGWGFVVN